VSEVELDDATLNVVHRPDGTLSYEDVVDKLKSPPNQSNQDGETVVVQHLRLRRGKANLIDRSGQDAQAGAGIALDQIDATVKARGKGGRPDAAVTAALGSKKRNVEAHIWQETDSLVRARVSVNELYLRDIRPALPPILGSIDGTMDLGREGRVLARAERIAVSGPGLALTGTGTLASAPLHVHVDLRGPELDVPQLLTAMPDGRMSGREAAPAKRRTRRAAVNVDGTLRVDRMKVGRYPFTDVDVGGVFSSGELTLSTCTAKVYGGRVDLSGSTADLAAPIPPWHLAARVEQVLLGRLFGGGSENLSLDGRLAGAMNVSGRGMTWPAFQRTATGRGEFSASDVSLSPELAGRIVAPVVSALSQVGVGAVDPNVLEPAWTRGGNARAKFAVAGGWLRLTAPLQAELPVGGASFMGQVGLNGRLQLSGTASLAPPLVARLTNQKLTPSDPIVVPIDVRGSIADPQVKTQLNTANVAKGLWRMDLWNLPWLHPSTSSPTAPRARTLPTPKHPSLPRKK
jgi:hypothetical protein